MLNSPDRRLAFLDRILRGQSVRAWFAELVKFGTVGLIAFVVDVGLFNLLRFGPGELLGDKPLTAKVISTSVAIAVAWLGNRLWAFRERRRSQHWQEAAMFVAVNLAGMAIAVGCLWVSHYLLGFTSALADNIAANGVGLVLGTVFRYLCYRYLVFTEIRPDDDAAGQPAEPAAATARGASAPQHARTPAPASPAPPRR